MQIRCCKKRHSAISEAHHYLEGRFQWCWRPQLPTTKLRTPAMRQPVLSADPSSLFLLNSFHGFQRSHHVNSISSLSLQPNHPPVDNHCPLRRPREEKKHVSQHEFLVIFPTTWQRGVRIPSVTCSLAVGSARCSTTLTRDQVQRGKMFVGICGSRRPAHRYASWPFPRTLPPPALIILYGNIISWSPTFGG